MLFTKSLLKKWRPSNPIQDQVVGSDGRGVRAVVIKTDLTSVLLLLLCRVGVTVIKADLTSVQRSAEGEQDEPLCPGLMTVGGWWWWGGLQVQSVAHGGEEKEDEEGGAGESEVIL